MGFPNSKILKQAYVVVRDNKFLWIHSLFLFWGRAAMIISVKAILDRQEAGLSRGFLLARRFSRQVMVLSVILGGILIIIFGTLAMPTFYLFTANLPDRAVILSTFGLCIFIPFAAVLAILNVLSAHFLCFYGKSPQASFLASWDLLTKKSLTLLIFSVLLWLGLFIAFVALVFVVFLIVLVFSGVWEWAFGVLILVPALAIIRAFHQTAWTLAFMELVKPVKFEETENLAPLPEVV